MITTNAIQRRNRHERERERERERKREEREENIRIEKEDIGSKTMNMMKKIDGRKYDHNE